MPILDNFEAFLLFYIIFQEGLFAMRIRINGKDEDMDAVSVLDVLKIRNIEPRMVAVEVNSKMIERDDYGTTQLKDDDEVEFLYFMGGGLYE